ncbi:MAG: hypothetical protein ACRDT4_24695 [Micromonosporaceae bacterium]
MRTKKVVVVAVAALGVAGALAVGGVALADEVDPRAELWIVNTESTGADKDCPNRDGDRGTPGEPGESGAPSEPGAGRL